MKKSKKTAADKLRSDYRRSVERLHARSNVVVLDPEVADLFPNADAVNEALRSLTEIAKRAVAVPRRSR